MSRIQIIQADITKMETDAIVNAANSSLLGGGGVDGAIHRAAGPQLLEACRQLNGCPAGEARITPGFLLPARYVIHTVGPVWRGGGHNEEELLHQAYISSMELGRLHQLQSIAFPNISTGVYGFPKELAAQLALQAVQYFMNTYADAPGEVHFVCFDAENLSLYQQLSR